MIDGPVNAPTSPPTGSFNESFSKIAGYFSDKSNVKELSIQIRSNDELALLLEFPNLQSLELSYVAEEVTDFQILNKLSLKSLSLKSINDLKWLSTLTNLLKRMLEEYCANYVKEKM